MNSLKRIPYGKSDFESFKGDYYIDKTMMIPHFEAAPFNFFLRPRRFGKSLLLSTMQTYYDVLKKDHFDEFYRDTWIFKNPTEERAKYMILYFNFSAVAKAIDKIQADFDGYCSDQINHFAKAYEALLPDGFAKELSSRATAHEKLRFICSDLQDFKLKIYVMIDEYDNFTNSEHGSDRYHALTHGSGAFRDFFSVLKAGTSGSGSPIARLFITGVSPVTMDDVTSGFNIGHNISHQYHINACCGFTLDEVKAMLDYYLREGGLRVERNLALTVLQKWAGGYRFSEDADEDVYNSDMVLYLINQILHSRSKASMPEDLIDPNVKTDYGKLRTLLMVELQSQKTLNGNFSKLKEIADTGEVTCKIKASFPNRAVAERDNFLSLIYHLGFLTRGQPVEGCPMLVVPNQSMQSILYEFMREGFKAANTFAVDVY